MYIKLWLLQHQKLPTHNANQIYARLLEIILEISFMNVKKMKPFGQQRSFILFSFPNHGVSECMHLIDWGFEGLQRWLSNTFKRITSTIIDSLHVHGYLGQLWFISFIFGLFKVDTILCIVGDMLGFLCFIRVHYIQYYIYHWVLVQYIMHLCH